jgi:2-methylcitrate dehydratase PrpD
MTNQPTATLMDGLVALNSEPLEPSVQDAATRSLFNVLGNAIGAAHADAVSIAVDYALASGATGEHPVLGRKDTLSAHTAALVNGIAVHYDDFDDTHLETVIHPGAVGLATLVATDPDIPLADAIRAFGLGIEGQLRIGSAISPSHYHRGWHITGTCGVFGAAITHGLLHGFDTRTLTRAIGYAATRAVGVREGFGTMTKPFHPGRAAVNGIRAAARANASDSDNDEPLVGDNLFSDVYADTIDVGRIVDGIGQHFELHDNAFKPYPCGIVSHPGIYAATLLSPRIERLDDIATVEIVSHPLVVDLTGNPAPTDGLEARFSTIHGVCAGLADGTVALAQYADDRVNAKDLVTLRAKATLSVNDTIARDQSRIIVTLKNGETLTEDVLHAPGSIDRPLTDDELYSKVDTLLEPVIPGHTDKLLSLLQNPNGHTLSSLWQLVHGGVR